MIGGEGPEVVAGRDDDGRRWCGRGVVAAAGPRRGPRPSTSEWGSSGWSGWPVRGWSWSVPSRCCRSGRRARVTTVAPAGATNATTAITASAWSTTRRTPGSVTHSSVRNARGTAIASRRHVQEGRQQQPGRPRRARPAGSRAATASTGSAVRAHALRSSTGMTNGSRRPSRTSSVTAASSPARSSSTENARRVVCTKSDGMPESGTVSRSRRAESGPCLVPGPVVRCAASVSGRWDPSGDGGCGHDRGR